MTKWWYSAGDIFWGLTMPECKNIAKEHRDISISDLNICIKSEVHDVRMISILILLEKYKTDPKKYIIFYLKNISSVNNWDLVDVSSSKILGDWSYKNNDTKTIFYLSKSKEHFKRRVAIISTFYYIKNGDDSITYKLAEFFINDKENLMHKATGWMLRECGKRVSRDNLINFLNRNATKMPRVMLRYSIEHFEDDLRKHYLSLK